MKFVVKALPKKKSNPKWKVQLRSYKKEDIEKYAKPGHKAKSIEFDLKKDEWARYGFSPDKSVEEAVERAKQLNAQQRLEDEKKARFGFQKRMQQEELIESAYVPKLLEAEFKEKLFKESDHEDRKTFYRTKIMSHWRACRKIIMEIELDPEDWEDEAKLFYKYFRKQNWSLSYSEKLIMLLNKWGKFCSKIQKSYFSEIPFPTSRNREKIVDNYHENVSRTKESAPLKFKDLERSKDKLKEEQYHWMYISLWFGLRPKEVDSLINGEGKTWKVGLQEGKTIFKVYQSKLTGISKDRRWKLIPCLFPEQKIALNYVRQQNFKRPLVKTIRRHIGEGYSAYAGRKGFETLLHMRDIPFDAISSYLGHTSVDRTWKNYRNRERALIPNLDSEDAA